MTAGQTKKEEVEQQKQFSALSAFFLLSILLHLLFFSLWQLSSRRIFDLEDILNQKPIELHLNLTKSIEPDRQDGNGQDLPGIAPPPKSAAADTIAPMPQNNNEIAQSFQMEDESPLVKSYHSQLRRQIIKRWIVPPKAKNNFKPGRLAVKINILQDGTLASIYIIESSGSTILDHAALEALRASSPFPPFPPELKALTQLELRLNFDYKAQYKNRR